MHVKNRDKRRVILCLFIIQSLLLYIDGERADVVKYASKIGKAARFSNKLFVNGVDSNHRDIGKAVRTATISRAFTRAVKACGLTRTELRHEIDPVTAEPKFIPGTNLYQQARIIVAAHTFHDLRHTFAVQQYYSEVARGNPEPWKKIQSLLRHERMSATIDVYLKHVNIIEAAVSDRYAFFIQDLHDAR